MSSYVLRCGAVLRCACIGFVANAEQCCVVSACRMEAALKMLCMAVMMLVLLSTNLVAAKQGGADDADPADPAGN